MPNAIVVYALCDPFSGEPRYVGVTENLKNRVSEHVAIGTKNYVDTLAAGGSPRPYSRWLGELAERGLIPMVRVLEEVIGGDRIARERHWITTLEASGLPLVNAECVNRRASPHEPDDYEKAERALWDVGQVLREERMVNLIGWCNGCGEEVWDDEGDVVFGIRRGMWHTRCVSLGFAAEPK